MTLYNITINDILPENLRYLGNLTISTPSGLVEGVNYTILNAPSLYINGGILTIVFNSSFVGTGSNSIVLSFRVYAPEFFTDNSTGENTTPIIDSNGVGTTAVNTVYVNGTLLYLVNDTLEEYYINTSASETVSLKSLAIQKTPTGTNVVPGQNITYTISYQVSDYFALDNFIIYDTLGNPNLIGHDQSLNYDVNVTFTYRNLTLSFSLNDTRFVTIVNTTDLIYITFNVSAILLELGINNLTGGLFSNLTGVPLVNDTAARGFISFVSTVNEKKEINATATADYTVINVVNGVATNLNSPIPNTVSDGSSTINYFPRLTLKKQLLAINNDTNITPGDAVSPGDNVTFQLTFTVYGGTVDFINLTDYLPYFLFSNAYQLAGSPNQTTGLIPTSGGWAYMTDGRLYDGNGSIVIPIVTVNGEIIGFYFNNTIDTEFVMRTIVIAFTLTVSDFKMRDGLTLTNRAFLYWSYVQDTSLESETIAPIIINQPDLTIKKQVDARIVENGTQANYTINVINIGNGNAFNITITDNFLELYGNYGVISNVYVVFSNGTNLTLNSSQIADLFNTSKGLNLGVLYGVSKFNKDPSFSNNFTIHYTVTYNTNPQIEEIINNTANITQFYPSAVSTNNFANDTNVTGIYYSSTNVTANTILFNKTFWKSNITNNTNLSVGDIGIFNLTVTLPQLIVQNLTITDILPNGLAFVKVEVIFSDGSVYNFVTTNVTTANGQIVTITFLDDIAASSAENRTFVILLYCQVLNNTTYIPVANSVLLNNRANLTWDNNDKNLSRNATAIVYVYQPNMTITKSFTPNNIQAGQNTNITITVSNVGTSTAYNVTVWDNLTVLFGDHFTNVTLIATGSSSAQIIGNILYVNYTSIAVGQTYTIILTIVNNDLFIGTSYNNTAYVNYTSIPLDDTNTEIRSYNRTSNIANLTSLGGNISKGINSTSFNGNSGNVSIGENITYVITVTLPQGLYGNFTLTDILPLGFKYTNYTIVNGNVTFDGPVTVSQSGQNVTILINGLLNATVPGSVFYIYVHATVLNDSSNNATVVKWNNVSMDWDANTANFTSRVNVTIVEPRLNITKNISPNHIQAGQNATVTIVVTNVGNSTAFNVTVYDDLSALFNDRFFNYTINAPNSSSIYLDPNNVLVITYDSLAPGASYTITFNITNNDLFIGKSYNNTAYVNYTSSNASDEFRFYNSTSNRANITSGGGNISKAINSTSNHGTSGNISVGDNITYVITVNLPQGLYYNFTITDILPPGFNYTNFTWVYGNVSFDPANITYNVSGQNVTIIFGGILNATIPDSVFYIYITATVLDVSINNNSAIKTNNVTMTWNDNLLNHRSSVNVTIVEPKLNVTKTFNPSNIRAGENTTINIVVTNVGNSTAYNVVVFDNLSAFIQDNFEIIFENAPGNLTYSLNRVTGILEVVYDSLKVGANFTITLILFNNDLYIGRSYNNTVYVNYTSSNASDQYRNYNTSSSAALLSSYGGNISKSINGTSNHGSSGNISVGDNITYVITVNLPQGLYYNFTITDILPPGFNYTNFTWVYGNVSFDPANITYNVSGQNVTIIFAGILNATIPDSIFFIYINATVFDVSSNNNSAIKTNNVSMTWDDNTLNHRSSVNVTIVEPKLNITKTFNPNHIKAGENTTLTIVVTNIGNSTAFNVTVLDDLSAFKTAGFNIIFVSAPGYVSYSLTDSGLLTVIFDRLPIGANFTITLILYNNDLYIGRSYNNTANVTYTSSDASDQYRMYNATSNIAYLTSGGGNISKGINGTSNHGSSGNISVGDNITYVINITLPQGLYANFTLSDLLPLGFNFTNYTIFVNGVLYDSSNHIVSNTPNGQQNVTIFFGNVLNVTATNTVFLVYINATVLDVSSNNNSAIKTNNVSMTWDDNTLNHRSSVNVTIVEPKLNVTKTFNPSNIFAGENTTLTIVVTNIGNSTAYNITVLDDLSAFKTAGFNITFVSAPGHVSYSLTDSGILTVIFDSLAKGANFTITLILYNNDLIIGKTYNNTANVTYTSSNASGHYRRYNATSNIAYLGSDGGDINKTINTTTYHGNSSNVTIGENITYVITINLPQGIYYNFTINDILPLGLNYTGYSIVFGDSLNFTGTLDNSTNNNIFTLILNGLLNATNIGDNTFYVYVYATVLNVSTNVGGVILENVANMTWNANTLNYTSGVNVTIVEPKLTINKTVNQSTANVTDSLQYNITIKNTGNSTAFNINLTDTLPDGVNFTGDYYLSSTDGWTYNYNPSTRTFTILGINLTVGSVFTFLFNVTVQNRTDLLNQNITNIANVTYASTNGSEFRAYGPTSANATFRIVVSDLNVTKTNITEVVAGQNVTYRINITNSGPDTAFNVIFTDYISSDLSNITYRINNGVWQIWEGNPTSVGNIGAGNSTIVEIRGLLNSSATGYLYNNVTVSTSTEESNTTNNFAYVNNTITTRAALNIVKSSNITGEYVLAGGSIQYNITVFNYGPSVARDVNVTDVLPSGLYNATYFNGTDWVVWNGIYYIGDLAPGENRTLLINAFVNQSARGVLNNTAYVNTSTNNTGNSSDNITTKIMGEENLSVTKTANVSSVNPGQFINYTIVVKNNGVSGSNNLVITDILDPSLFYNNTATYDWYVNNTSLNGSGVWNGTLFVGHIDAGATVVLNIVVQVIGNFSANFTNLVNVTTDDTPEGVNDSSIVKLNIADLQVNKSVNNPNPNYQDIIIYTITVRNNGPDNATGVQVVDKLPSGLIFINSTDDLNYNSVSVLWNIGNISNETVVTLNITCRVDRTGSFTNFVNITAYDQYDNNLNNNNYTLIINSPNASDLSVSKINTTEVVAGQNITYQINITNNGPNTATGVNLTDSIPIGLSNIWYKIGDGAWTQWTLAGDLILSDIGNIKVGSSLIILINGTLDSSAIGAIFNNVSVSSSTVDIDLSNNFANITNNITTRSALNITKVSNATKDLNGEYVHAGDSIQYVITVVNYGPSVARNVVVNDILPTNLYNALFSVDGGMTWNPWNGIYGIGDMTSSQIETILITAYVNESARGILNNTAEITTTTNNTGNNSSNLITDILVVENLTITKVANVSNVNPGQFINYTIVVTNNGISASHNMVIHDILNSSYFINDTATYSWYVNNTLLNGSGDWNGTLYLGNISAGATVVLNIIVQVNPNISSNITNVANVTTHDTPEGIIDGSSIVMLNVVNIEINKTVSNSTPNYLHLINYTITVTNNGPDNATNLKVYDLLPSGLVFISYTTINGTYDNVTGLWFIENLDVGQTVELIITALVNNTGTSVNIANLTVDQYNTGNNTTSVDINVSPVVNLTISKTVNVTKAIIGQSILYTITISNFGPDSATGVAVYDLLPNGLYYLNSSASQGTYNSTSGLWGVGILDNGTSATLYISARITSFGNLTNNVNVTNNEINYGKVSAFVSIQAIHNTSITVNATLSSDGKTMTITSRLTDESGNPLANKTIKFYVNGIYVGQAVTNVNGVAQIKYYSNIPFKAGNYTIEAVFAGDDLYPPANATTILEINKTNNETNDTNKTNGTDKIDTDEAGGNVTNIDENISGSTMKKTALPINAIAIILMFLSFFVTFRRKRYEK